MKAAVKDEKDANLGVQLRKYSNAISKENLDGKILGIWDNDNSNI